MLFMSVNASPHDQDLEVLWLISEHDDFRHYVREIVYFEVFFHPVSLGVSLSTLTHRTMQPCNQIYVHVFFIASALARMPSLRGLITLKNHWLPPREEAESAHAGYGH
jgi:hypothetical protein